MVLFRTTNYSKEKNSLPDKRTFSVLRLINTYKCLLQGNGRLRKIHTVANPHREPSVVRLHGGYIHPGLILE